VICFGGNAEKTKTKTKTKQTTTKKTVSTVSLVIVGIIVVFRHDSELGKATLNLRLETYMYN